MEESRAPEGSLTQCVWRNVSILPGPVCVSIRPGKEGLALGLAG